MNEFDAVVVGASISGCRTAELIARNGYKVAILEEHEKVGIPLKCTGLVSWRLKELLKDIPEDIIINQVNEAKFYYPTNEFFSLHPKNPVFVIDRKKLDQYLFERAVSAGAKPFLGTKFLSFDSKNALVKTTGKALKTKILIGADGGNSFVARSLNLKQPATKLIGIQSTVKGNFENCVEVWFGSYIAPNFFAWVVPINESIARIGLATDQQPMYYFKEFSKRRVGTFTKPNTAGIIRIGLMKETVADRCLLVGDAACMIKPFSGGGIIYGLIGSRFCTDACIEALERQNFSKGFLKKAYDKKWKRVLSGPIRKGMFYRRILSSTPDLFMHILFSLVKKFGKGLLERFDMDFLENFKLES